MMRNPRLPTSVNESVHNDEGANSGSPITSVTRAFTLLELLAFADGPKSLADVSHELHLPPSTAHRFLRALIALGYVAQDRQTATYQATLKLFNLGNMVIAKFNLSERLLPVMRRVAEQTGEAVSLVFRESFEGVLLERVEGPGSVPVFSKYRRVPLYCTAAGKAILSGFDDKTLQKYLSRTPLKARTKYTLTSPSELRKEVERIRQDGFALDDQEAEIGARCVAVPLVLTNALMALSVSAMAPRMTDDRMRDIAALMLRELASAGLGQLQKLLSRRTMATGSAR